MISLCIDSHADPNIQRTFISVLNLIIPPCEKRGLPGGGEVGLVLDAELCEGMVQFQSEARGSFGREFFELNVQEQTTVVGVVKGKIRPFIGRLEKRLAECYYQDSRVIESHGMRGDAPFPDGYHVEDGDLTLLEAVYLREKIFRDCGGLIAAHSTKNEENRTV